EPPDYFAVLHLARHRPRRGPLQIALAEPLGIGAPRGLVEREALERLHELRIAGVDCERWATNPPPLLGARVHVAERLLRHRRFDERIGARRHLAKPCA